MPVSRRRMLLLGVPVLGTSGLVAAAAGSAAASTPSVSTGFVSAPDVGIAPSNSSATNTESLMSALSGSAVCVVFPPGDYQIDNTNSRVLVEDYAGELVMLPGARLVFTDRTARGLTFHGGTGARLYGLATAFAAAPVSRADTKECVIFDETTDTYLENVRIDGSAAAGLLFWRCVRPTVVGASITNTMADGLNFSNCRDGRADHISTVNTGDDGVSFVNYASGPANTGGLATNISVSESKSRGVAVVGQSGVTVRDAIVDTTASHGLYCAYEESWKTRVPTGVYFGRCFVRKGGAWAAAEYGGTSSGLRVADAGTVKFTDITVDSPGGHGGYATASTVTLVDVMVKNTPLTGFSLRDGQYTVDRVTVEDTKSIGFTAAGCRRLEYRSLTLKKTAITSSSHCAVYLQDNAYVYGDRLWICDDQASATGYVVGAHGNEQKGSLGTIVDLVTSRGLSIDNPSGLSYSMA